MPDFLAFILCKRYEAQYFNKLNRRMTNLEIEKKAKISVYLKRYEIRLDKNSKEEIVNDNAAS